MTIQAGTPTPFYFNIIRFVLFSAICTPRVADTGKLINGMVWGGFRK